MRVKGSGAGGTLPNTKQREQEGRTVTCEWRQIETQIVCKVDKHKSTCSVMSEAALVSQSSGLSAWRFTSSQWAQAWLALSRHASFVCEPRPVRPPNTTQTSRHSLQPLNLPSQTHRNARERREWSTNALKKKVWVTLLPLHTRKLTFTHK